MTSIYGRALRGSRGDRPVLSSAVRFDIQNVADYYWKDPRTDWDIHKGDFPNLAPPYPCFWMEYAVPRDEIITEEGVLKDLPLDEEGFLFLAYHLDEDRPKALSPKVEWIVEWRWWSLIGPGSFNGLVVNNLKEPFLHDWDIRCAIGVSADGSATPMFRDGREMGLNVPPTIGNLPPEEFQGWKNGMFAVLHPCLLAISFLHCKNVTVERPEDQPTRSARRRRNRETRAPAYQSHTIRITPMRRVLEKEGGMEASGKGFKRAVSVCRGHFKDFREGRGLFGKHHGLYWWDAQQAANMPDYKIRPPKK